MFEGRPVTLSPTSDKINPQDHHWNFLMGLSDH
jgi:hypothetical protein